MLNDSTRCISATFIIQMFFVFLGFVISAICELERNAIQLALGSFYPTLLLSGTYTILLINNINIIIHTIVQNPSYFANIIAIKFAFVKFVNEEEGTCVCMCVYVCAKRVRLRKNSLYL